MREPTISVIMSVFNNKSYVAESILSVLNQTFLDFEFIITDDGSTDGSLGIIESFASQDKRIKIIYNTQSNGLPNALNAMIELSKANYIARMDSDDICLPDRFEKQISFLKNNNSVGIVGGQAILINNENVEIGNLKKPVSIDKLEKYLHFRCPVIHPTYMVRSSVYKSLKGYRNLVPGEDYDFLLRANNGKVIISNLPDYVLKYRVNYQGISYGNLNGSFWYAYSIRKMHSMRSRGQKDDDIFDGLMGMKYDESSYLQAIHKLRNKILKKSRNATIIKKSLLKFVYFCLTFLDYRIAYNAYLTIKISNLIERK